MTSQIFYYLYVLTLFVAVTTAGWYDSDEEDEEYYRKKSEEHKQELEELEEYKRCLEETATAKPTITLAEMLRDFREKHGLKSVVKDDKTNLHDPLGLDYDEDAELPEFYEWKKNAPQNEKSVPRCKNAEKMESLIKEQWLKQALRDFVAKQKEEAANQKERT